MFRIHSTSNGIAAICADSGLGSKQAEKESLKTIASTWADPVLVLSYTSRTLPSADTASFRNASDHQSAEIVRPQQSLVALHGLTGERDRCQQALMTKRIYA